MNWALPVCLLLALSTLNAEQYCFGFLNAFPNRADLPKEQLEQIQAGHMAHLTAMGKLGRLLAAGPMATQDGPRGIVVFRCQSVEQAVAWSAEDPAVVNNRLTVDMHLWNASAGLGLPPGSPLNSDPDPKYTMIKLPLMILRKTPKAAGGIPDSVLQAHFEHYTKLNAQGKVRIAGPFAGSQTIIGVLMMSAMSLDDAKALMADEPLVRHGYAELEPHIWFVADEVIPKPSIAAS